RGVAADLRRPHAYERDGRVPVISAVGFRGLPCVTCSAEANASTHRIAHCGKATRALFVRSLWSPSVVSDMSATQSSIACAAQRSQRYVGSSAFAGAEGTRPRRLIVGRRDS